MEHEVSIVKRFDTVLERARDLIATAENEIQVGIDEEQFPALRSPLADANDRGVTIKLSIYQNPDVEPVTPERLEGVCTEARRRTIPASFLVLVDREWTCFAPHRHSVSEYGLIVNDHTQTYVYNWFFLTCLWEIWETVYTERSPETPTKYVDLRQAVRDVDPLLSDGATVRARVRGYEIESKDPVELTGTITGVEYTGRQQSRRGDVPLARLAGKVTAFLDVDGRVYEIGGWGAVLEEIEATEITILDVQRP